MSCNLLNVQSQIIVDIQDDNKLITRSLTMQADRNKRGVFWYAVSKQVPKNLFNVHSLGWHQSH